MSAENTEFKSNGCPAGPHLDKVVMLKIGGVWTTIETAGQAWQCLQQWVGDRSDPSFRRALGACEALLRDGGSAEAARSTLVVAAMSAGISFEVHGDSEELMERQLAILTESELLDLMPEVDSSDIFLTLK
jgi:hypothetical protein